MVVPMSHPAAEPDPERGLIERAQRGDREAQDALFQQHLPGVHAWVRLKCSDLVRQRESSLDIVQSVFRQVLMDLPKFEYRGPNGFRNWLLTYAENKLRNREQFHRAERRSPAHETDASLSHFYASICTPSQLFSAKEQVERFERAFAELTPKDQELVLLAKFEQLSHVAIGERVGLTEAASKKALSRALVRLASRLTQES